MTPRKTLTRIRVEAIWNLFLEEMFWARRQRLPVSPILSGVPISGGSCGILPRVHKQVQGKTRIKQTVLKYASQRGTASNSGMKRISEAVQKCISNRPARECVTTGAQPHAIYFTQCKCLARRCPALPSALIRGHGLSRFFQDLVVAWNSDSGYHGYGMCLKVRMCCVMSVSEFRVGNLDQLEYFWADNCREEG